jgi:hypothetical protein
MSAHRREQPVSGWAAGGLAFAACLLLLIGAFQVTAGLAAIIDGEFLVVGENYAFNLDTTAWGWIHLLLGVIIAATALGLFSRSAWAGVTAVFLAMLGAVANFLFIPYQPFWAIVLIALNVWVIWSLTRPGVIRT